MPECAILFAWTLTATITVAHHEKWADEAQSWLLARDLSLPVLWFRELRYEGTPGAWHTLLWLSQRLFHLPYSGLGFLAVTCALAGAALILFHSPFPRTIRWLLVFSYYVVYQYAVVARPYVLLPLLSCLAALWFKEIQRPFRMTIALILLANLSVHGFIIAACIGFAYSFRAVRSWRSLDSSIRRAYVISGVVSLAMLVFLVAVLKPPTDVAALRQVQWHLSAVAVTAWHGVNGAFFDVPFLTIVWITLLLAWSITRRLEGLLLLALIASMSLFYGMYGAPHHQGTIFVCAIAGFWIAWPSAAESTLFPISQQWLHRSMIAALICLFGYQAANAAFAIRNDYRLPYSGAQDTANFLKSSGADRQRIMGFGYGMVAVQAYFDHNIEINRPHAYFHHSLISPIDQMAEIKRLAPDFTIVPCWEDCDLQLKTNIEPFMRDAGYFLAHFSDGYLFDKRTYDVRQAYVVFRRK